MWQTVAISGFGFVLPFIATWLVFIAPYGDDSGHSRPVWIPLLSGIAAGVVVIVSICFAFARDWPKD